LKKGSSVYKVARFWVHLLMCYISILLMLGYSYGSGDMGESLSAILKLNNPALLPNDFYTSFLLSSPVHERLVFIHLLNIGQSFPATWALILHAGSSLLLISGLYKISSLVLTSRFFRWITIFSALVVLNNYNLGGNELYYNYLVPSLPAKALAAWSLFFFFKRNLGLSVLFALGTALFQPIVALQIISISALSSIPLYLEEKKFDFKNKWAGLLMMIPLAVYLWMLWKYHNLTAIDTQTYKDIISLRMPHHFIPSYFPLKSVILYGAMVLFALYWYFRNFRILFYWNVILLMGCLVYMVLLNLPTDIGLMTQWFKSTIWLEFFAVLAIIGFINDRLMMRLNMAYFFGILLTILIALLYLRLPPLNDKPYEFGKRWMNYETVEIALAAKELTPDSALFIIPPDINNFRHVAQRSLFVDFKSIAHNKAYLAEWQTRVQAVYNLRTGNQEPWGFAAVEAAKNHYSQLYKPELEEFIRNYGITHMLTDSEHLLPYPIIVRTKHYIIYDLRHWDGEALIESEM